MPQTFKGIGTRYVGKTNVDMRAGTCEACQTGRRPAGPPVTTDLVFARDALRIAIATERSGREFYTRAARLTRDARGRRVFEKLAAEDERTTYGVRDRRTREIGGGRTVSSNRIEDSALT